MVRIRNVDPIVCIDLQYTVLARVWKQVGLQDGNAAID